MRTALLPLIGYMRFFQEKEIYRWPIKESLKTMLAWGWRVERTREGDTMALYNRSRRISQTSQVYFELQALLIMLLSFITNIS